MLIILVGIAACNIGGTTIHSFAGFGLGEGTIQQMVTKVRKNRKAVKRWLTTKVLIIDEGQHSLNRPRPRFNMHIFQSPWSMQTCLIN